MNIFRRLFLAIALLASLAALSGCGKSGSGSDQQLYLRTAYAFGNLSINTLLLGPGDRIVMDADGGVNPVDLSKIDPKNVGTYKLNGKDKFDIQWGGGRGPQTVSVEFHDGALSAFDGGLVSKAQAYAKGEKLDATYSGSLSAGGVGAARNLTFTKDGRFTMGTTGTVSTALTGGTASGSSQGTYELSENTLTLKHDNGAVEKRTVLPFNTARTPAEAKGTDEKLIFEHMMLTRTK